MNQFLSLTVLALAALVVLPPFDGPRPGSPGPAVTQAGSATVGGRRMSCSAARVVMSKASPVVGVARSGVVVLNPLLLRRYPAITRRMIFLHECAHQYVGLNETGADCWAVKSAIRQGWLRTVSQVKLICRSFIHTAGSFYHPPGPQRCNAMLQCFRDATGNRTRNRRASRRRSRR